MSPSAPPTFLERRKTPLIAAIALLWALFALLASLGNSSVFDEPLHAPASAAAIRGQLGINIEHPPLWKYIAGLPHLSNSSLDLSPSTLAAMRNDHAVQWRWGLQQMYGANPPEGEAFIRASHLPMLLFGIVLILLGGALANKIAGPKAALLTAVLLALNPLLIAHGPIVSNDVAVSAGFLASFLLAYSLRTRPTPLKSILLGLAVGATLCTKFTGILALPLALLIAFPLRAFSLRPVHIRHPTSPIRHLPLLLLTTYFTIWAVYLFRFAPSPDGSLISTHATLIQIASQRNQPVEVIQSLLPIKLALFAESYKLFPQAFLEGLMLSYGINSQGYAFAAGLHSNTGFWWYFPFALLVKTPIALLIAFAAAVFLIARGFNPLSSIKDSAAPPGVLGGKGIPAVKPASESKPLILATLALFLLCCLSPRQSGLRLILPAIALATPLIAAALTQLKPKLIAALLALLLLETAAAFPHYLAYFNFPARLIGPEKLLADTNLDWGQDLARLAAWRKAHPDKPLHLAYWGTVDPRAYNLDAVILPRSILPNPLPPLTPGYYAISISFLQNQRPNLKPYYSQFREKPAIRIGSSIYLFDIDRPYTSAP